MAEFVYSPRKQNTLNPIESGPSGLMLPPRIRGSFHMSSRFFCLRHWPIFVFFDWAWFTDRHFVSLFSWGGVTDGFGLGLTGMDRPSFIAPLRLLIIGSGSFATRTTPISLIVLDHHERPWRFAQGKIGEVTSNNSGASAWLTSCLLDVLVLDLSNLKWSAHCGKAGRQQPNFGLR